MPRLTLADEMRMALEEFIRDVDAIGGGEALGTPGQDFWPDLLLTYNKAKRLIERAHK